MEQVIKSAKEIVRPVRCGPVQNALLVIVAIPYSMRFTGRIVPVSVRVSDSRVLTIRNVSDVTAIKYKIMRVIKNRVWRAGTGHGRTGHAISVPEPLAPMGQHVNNKKNTPPMAECFMSILKGVKNGITARRLF